MELLFEEGMLIQIKNLKKGGNYLWMDSSHLGSRSIDIVHLGNQENGGIGGDESKS